MPFEPDVVVLAPGGRVLLVVEVKLTVKGRQAGEAQLKRYMVGMRCPVGLLVTPKLLALYRDSYTDYTADSIERVGQFNTSSIDSFHDVETPLEFERAVRVWLEALTGPSARDQLPADLREAVEELVLPALEEGEVRASGPRGKHPTTT